MISHHANLHVVHCTLISHIRGRLLPVFCSVMDSVTRQRETMRGALLDFGLAADEVAKLTHEALDKLFLAEYHLPGRLLCATREQLMHAGLSTGAAGFIIHRRRGKVSEHSSWRKFATIGCMFIRPAVAHLTAK